MLEQRCTDLGSACICSEPMQMTGFAKLADAYSPNDSTQKCSFETSGYAIGIATGNSIDTDNVGTDSVALNALPAGHSVQRFFRTDDGYAYILSIGVRKASQFPASMVRTSVRWYHYWSSDFQFTGEGSCLNAKFIECDLWNMTTDVGGNIHCSNTAGDFTPDIDCCTSGPGSTWGSNYNLLRGKWWRLETVETGREGPDYRMIIYGKQVTDNEEEKVFADMWAFRNDLTPNSLSQGLNANMWRSGTCLGWAGVSHLMAAGWTTNEGQRIGAASEIEGGGGGGGGTQRYHNVSLHP